MSINLQNQSQAKPRRTLVLSVVERLRERVFAEQPGERIGGLSDLAQALDVGIVTIQQAARVLEHEGLLEVRRGPGGGYYGRRPDAKTLERSLAAWMRMHPTSFGEALDMTSLLFNELCGAAAQCSAVPLRTDLSELLRALDGCDSEEDIGVFETRFQDLLFQMVDRPIFELLTRVTLRFATAKGSPQIHHGADGIARWVSGRRRIIAAICAGDEALARFEAHRSNRMAVLDALSDVPAGGDAGQM